jgi:tight adherence protein B
MIWWLATVTVGLVGLQWWRDRWVPPRLRSHRVAALSLLRFPQRWVDRWSARRDTGDLAEVVERMATSLRSGRAMPVALAEAGAGVAGRLGLQLDLVLADTAAGMSFTAALEAWSQRDGSRDVGLVVVALVLGLEVGGQRARVLEEVAEAIRERRALRQDADRQATQARLSAWVVALAPLGFAAVAFLSNPEAARFLVATPPGWVCLALGLSLDGLGAWWMRGLGRRATWSS